MAEMTVANLVARLDSLMGPGVDRSYTEIAEAIIDEFATSDAAGPARRVIVKPAYYARCDDCNWTGSAQGEGFLSVANLQLEVHRQACQSRETK